MSSSTLNDAAPPQIQDDPDLFRLMLQDEKGQDSLWCVARYWTYYMDMVTSEILSGGVTRFRANDQIASSFCSVRPSLFLRQSAAELDVENAETGTHRGADSSASRIIPTGIKKWIARHALRWPIVADVFRWFRVPNLSVMADRYFFMSLRLAHTMMRRFEETMDLMASVSDSRAGSPTDLVRSGAGYLGQDMTYAILYISLLRSAAQGRPVRRVLEIGGGYGALCEAAQKGWPAPETYVILDLPQTCYVTAQYLKSVFPGQVSDYRDFAGCEKIDVEALLRKRIVVLPTWMLPRIQMQFDWLVNTASFQEMEPGHVSNYAQHAARLADQVFCWTLKDGHGRGFNDNTVTIDGLSGIFEKAGFSTGVYDAPEARSILAQLQPLYADRVFKRNL
jgi:putative sugar O-methyltransferase